MIRQFFKKFNTDLFSRVALLLVIAVAVLNHWLTFLAYDWYAGIDSYSYDVSGLQLVSGRFFDIFPVLFRAPLIPIAKNLLYLVFEGHPYALSVLLHFLGVMTAILAYRLGSRFHKAVGFAMGMLMALNLNISVYFHHISVTTFIIPLFLLAADCFVAWVKKPNIRTLTWVIIVTIMCFLARTEALILVPIFWMMGWFCHRLWKQAAIFLVACLLAYNFVGFLYYKQFGYWGLTHNTGWALFTRVTRAIDKQFDISNGPASRKLGEYMSRQWPLRTKDTHPIYSQMYTLNLAQQELGFVAADDLFKQASIEAIFADPKKFAKFTLFRILGQLDLYCLPGLSHSEFPYETASGHMWGFKEKRMQDNQEEFKKWLPDILKTDSPFLWERRAIKSRLIGMLGIKTGPALPPDTFFLSPNVELDPSGEIVFLACEDGNMKERLQSCRQLDIYFFLKYWGQKGWSKGALRLLQYWDTLMPHPSLRMNLHRIMWVLWIIGIFLSRERWRKVSLATLLFVVLSFAVCQSIASDNFGGRFALYNLPYLWLGGLAGAMVLIQHWKNPDA
jgi:hypothetical protein